MGKISRDKIERIQLELKNWGKKNFRDFPWRKTVKPFHALIAEIMLQRTKAKQVLPVYAKFIEKYPNIKTTSLGDLGGIRQLLWPLGLRWRTEKIIELINKLGEIDKIPENQEDLIKLPGVGLYVANAYLSLYRNVKAPILDRNAVRVWSRILGFKSKSETHKKKWFYKLVQDLTPSKGFRQFNYALLDFAGAICAPNPRCDGCPIAPYCTYYSKHVTKGLIDSMG